MQKPLQMPKAFQGRCTRTRVYCGICQREETFRPPHPRPEDARSEARDLGWTYIDGLGWVCACRHQCQNLPENRRPRARPHSGRRHGKQKSGNPRLRRLRERRRRQKVE